MQGNLKGRLVNLGVWLAILSGAFYGTSGLFGEHLIKEGFGVSDFLFWRYLLIIVILLPFLNSKKQWQDIVSKDGLILIALAAIFYESSTFCFFYSMETIGTGLATVLFCCYPFFVVLLNWLHGKNPPSNSTLKGLLVIVLGIILLSEPSNWALSMKGIMWGILCAVGFSLYFYASQDIIKKISISSSAFCISFGNMVIFACIDLFDTSFQLPNTWFLICNIGCFAIFATLIPLYCVCKALHYIDSTKASILSLFQIIVTIALGIMFLNERITLLQCAGVIVVVIGAYIVQNCKKELIKN